MVRKEEQLIDWSGFDAKEEKSETKIEEHVMNIVRPQIELNENNLLSGFMQEFGLSSSVLVPT